MNDQETSQAIGKRIRMQREKLGITQHELALRCDFETSNLSRIEAGRTNITIRSLRRISDALGIPFYKLTDGIQ